jgi:hypothetical protein
MQMWCAASGKAVCCIAALAVAALGMLLPETTRAQAGAPPLQPAQETRPAPAANPAATQARPAPSAAELETWRERILHTRKPKKSCYMANYPDTTWTEVTCIKPPNIPQQLPACGPAGNSVGTFQHESAQARGISQSEGSFDVATGVTTECGVQCPGGQCPKTSSCTHHPLNAFTLQLNTQYFPTAKGCADTDLPANCEGFEQFVFSSSQCGMNNQCSGPATESKACVYIQYWLIDYRSDNTCPASWQLSTSQPSPGQASTGQASNCFINSTIATPVPQQVLTSTELESLKLTGAAPKLPTNAGPESLKLTGGIAGIPEDDTVTLTIGSTVYSASGDDHFPELGSEWQYSEFNVLGDGCGSQAWFNSGTTLQVRTQVESPMSAPSCSHTGCTGETNNLNLLPGTCSGVGGTSPAIVFTEALPAGHQGSTALLYDANDGQADVVGFGSNGNQSMDYPNTGFRTSWSLIAAGYFTMGSQQQVVLYDQTAGLADVVAFGSNGKYNRDVQSPGLGTSFDKMVAGYFIGNGREQVLLYNSNSGEADVVGFNANGTKNLDFKNTNFGNWDTILPGAFLTNGQQEQVFLYNRKAGHAAIVTFDSEGKASPPVLNTGFRTSWDLLVAGHFIGNGRSDKPAGVVLYDRTAGEAEVVAFDTKGGVISYPTNRGFRTTWTQMVAGDFIKDARDQILIYDQNAGDVDVVAFDTKGGESLDYTNHGFRTTWAQMFTAAFVGSGNGGEIGPEQVLLYDGNSGELDVVGFDKNEPKGKAILDGQNSRYRGSSDIIAVGALVPN